MQEVPQLHIWDIWDTWDVQDIMVECLRGHAWICWDLFGSMRENISHFKHRSYMQPVPIYKMGQTYIMLSSEWTGMPISYELKKQVLEALNLIDSGQESYRSLAKRFNVPKSTIFRWHHERLSHDEKGRELHYNLDKVETVSQEVFRPQPLDLFEESISYRYLNPIRYKSGWTH